MYKMAIWTILLIDLLGDLEEAGRGLLEHLCGDMVRRIEGNLSRMKGGHNRGMESTGVLEERKGGVGTLI